MGVRIRQKDGKWYVFINHQGKRKAKCVGDSKKAALEVKRKLEAKLTLGDFDLLDDKPIVPTFAEYAEKWLDQYVAVACKRSSQRVIRGIVHNHLVPYFGGRELTNISRAEVKAFLAQKKSTLQSEIYERPGVDSTYVASPCDRGGNPYPESSCHDGEIFTREAI